MSRSHDCTRSCTRRPPIHPRGSRVILNRRALWRDGVGRTGTVVLTWGLWGSLRWAVVELDSGSDVTCRMRELDPCPPEVYQAP